MASDRISVRVSTQLQKGLAAFAQSTGKTEAEIVRAAIDEYLQNHSKQVTAFDVAKAAGLIGCVKGGPTDRSTNPKYMEEFGRE